MTDVELVKSKLDIVDFISGYITLKKAGRNFKALCPFHSEKTPSFVVSPERQTWHCFGGCAMGGDAITFYEKWEGVDFVEALKSLAEKTGVTLQKFTSTDDSRQKEKLYAVNDYASDFFHFLLTQHKVGLRGRDYLDGRKIKKEIIESFSLGYAPESWDSLMKFMSKKGFSGEDLFSAGLVVRSEKGKYYDRFRGRLMFTLKDQRGKIIGFSGRTLDPADTGAKYINSPETLLYIKGNSLYGLDKSRESIKKEGFAILVEGEFDFLASFQNGITNIAAIKGSALTENQVLMIKRYADTVHLALDSDFAGSEAAKRGIDIAENSGLTVKVINLLKGKDPADCITEGIGFWKKSVEAAVPIYDFIISNSFKKYDPKEAAGKKKIADEVVPFLAKIQNPIILSHYVKKLAKDLGVNEDSVETAIELSVKKKSLKKVGIAESVEKKDRIELLEEHLLSMILQGQNVRESLEFALNIVTIEDFSINSIRIIVGLIGSFLIKNEKFDVRDFGKYLTPEVSPVFDRAYLTDLAGLSDHAAEYKKELEKTAKEIKKIALRREITKITTELSRIEDDLDESDSKKLNSEIRIRLGKLKELEA